MLQDPEPQTRTPGVIGGKIGIQAANASNRKTRRQRAMDATNGWATEDATDIQDLPEFDFAGSRPVTHRAGVTGLPAVVTGEGRPVDPVGRRRRGGGARILRRGRVRGSLPEGLIAQPADEC